MANNLKHMAYELPTTPGSEGENVCEPRTPSEELSQSARILIPVFQRRYCWTPRHAQTLLADALNASFGRHTIGKIVFSPTGVEGEDALLCIDGQQRLTTISIIIAAIRNVASHLEGGEGVVADCERLLFVDRDAVAAWRDAVGSGDDSVLFQRGDDVPFVRLSPSWPDRDAFFAFLIGHDHVDHSELDDEAYAIHATQCSVPPAAKVAESAVKNAVGGSVERLAWVLATFTSSLSFIHFETPSAENAIQMFLWLQEKSIMTSLLMHIEKPGVTLSACDLTRNLVLAHWMALPGEEQSQRYRNQWLPLDTQFPTSTEFDAFLADFATTLPEPEEGDEVVALPPAVTTLSSRIRVGKIPDFSNIQLYFAIATWVKKVIATATPDQDPVDTILSAFSQHATTQ